MAGKGGGAWKVAYADFVTAMMAFFMVMWIVGQGQDVKQAISQYFNDPTGNQKKPDALIPGYRTGRGDFLPSRGQPGGPQARGKGYPDDKRNKPGRVSAIRDPSLFVLHDGDRRTIGTVIEFPEDSAECDDQTLNDLKKYVPLWLGKRNKIEIRGHTTRRPLPADSPYRSSWELCYARCMAVMDCLLKAGIEPERIRLSQAAANEPRTLADDANKQALNSRVEVHLLNEFVEDTQGTQKERDQRFQSPVALEP